jgi:hypothetical protein
VDAQAKKLALKSIQYGLLVLTSIEDEELAAAGVNWLSQAPLNRRSSWSRSKTTTTATRSSNAAEC